ncbi:MULTISPECIES: hypothetical protein [unclassified Streptomyces]|uniref:hypothetical protein n=1 Tax=unclassified Streptomyces TaxID=2593676 RepID=UPI0024B6D709|nr:hypothetical protein [Streptomyces sp. KAU_LT]MDI9835373.1 hypothetical protein [Streptomyces sp. KAU_LT]
MSEAEPRHLAPATLVEWALRGDGPGDDGEAARHLTGCAGCREHLSRLRRVVTVAREVEARDVPSAPGRHVWERIEDELRSSREPDDRRPED